MICDKCKNKPVARGIKNIVCFSCNKSAIVNCFHTNICNKCSDENIICQYCGEKGGMEIVDLLKIGEDVYRNRDKTIPQSEKEFIYKKLLNEMLENNQITNENLNYIFEEILNVKYIKENTLASWLDNEITFKQMVEIQKQ
jgi:hypothetical protein